MFTITPKLFSVKILTGTQRALAESVYYRKDLPMSIRVKYDWYFKYREALVRIEKPKNYTELIIVAYDAPQKTIQQIEEKRKKDKIIAAKARITKIKNRIDLFRSEYNSLFPIKEDPIYQKLEYALWKSECDLKILSKEDENSL
jgi:hypothetical protein